MDLAEQPQWRNNTQNPKPMNTEEGTITDDQKKAEAHNKYFVSINKASKLTD